MARPTVLVGLFAAAALIAAAPATAQFGSIFSDPPPRPPADVPSAPPGSRAPPRYYPGAEPPPSRTNQPPVAPLPAPMALPPQNRPGAGIESQSLEPPPGAAPPQQANQPPAGGPPRETSGPPRTLPGLPPGQRQPPGSPQQQPADAVVTPPKKEVVEEPPPQRIPNPTAVFSGLDKITGRITSFDVAINETVQFGALQVTPRVCYSRPPTETPQTDAFIEVDEVTLKGEIKRIFTGWMFAASPGLHAVEHPIYDVWLTDCKGGKNPAVAEAPPEDDKAAKPPPRRAPPRRQPAPRGFLR